MPHRNLKKLVRDQGKYYVRFDRSFKSKPVGSDDFKRVILNRKLYKLKKGIVKHIERLK